jgi:hypothetical protein
LPLLDGTSARLVASPRGWSRLVAVLGPHFRSDLERLGAALGASARGAGLVFAFGAGLAFALGAGLAFALGAGLAFALGPRAMGSGVVAFGLTIARG